VTEEGGAELRRRNRLFIAVVAVVLAFSPYLVGYLSSPLRSELGIIAENHARQPFWPEMGLMILCPNRAREMDLCNIDERQLHAKYVLTVSPPPKLNPIVTWKVVLVPEEVKPPKALGARAMESVVIPTVDKSSDFTGTHTRIGESKFKFDLAFIGDPDDEEVTTRYMLLVTVDYDEPLLPWMRLFTRKASGVAMGDLCLLGYNVGKHPPPNTPKSEKPLGEFRSCDAAVSWQRQMLGLEPSCQICTSEFMDNSYVTVHVVDAYGKPIQNVTVSLNTTSCCWIDYRDLSWTGQYISEATDSDGNAEFPVTPYTRYTVMVEGVVFSDITAPPPTASTTITVILT